ncbi:MarR family winged helix-turn-helix transcriptional regulator [Pararobbsia silviterrae]|uniref:MarR family transcriptional regulator n=1 Tax=Pararobbsia silviterrae TaxID=1792498 RepID=A0A494XSC7_9BURK|nr:MarR family transcriptional regulator [Pararobbsia silviterrae]RKP53540.1 MarR family transcriptional regulator [Pararobbsia silviterrae]
MRASPSSSTIEPLAALAGELRISLGKLNRRLREQAQSGDFTSSQRSVFLRLERDGPATVSALARAEGVKPQSMRITVALLEAQGAVVGEADPHDGRKTVFTLTPAFKRTLKASRSAREDWLFHALQTQLTSDEHTTLSAAVKLLQRLADY